ncbi:unnamed protein product [Rhodiola kirilowii]
MASSRIARFATEAAPAQFVSVMRQRANKMLDTIQEEEVHANKTTTATSVGASSARRNAGSSGFLNGVGKSISILGH